MLRRDPYPNTLHPSKAPATLTAHNESPAISG